MAALIAVMVRGGLLLAAVDLLALRLTPGDDFAAVVGRGPLGGRR